MKKRCTLYFLLFLLASCRGIDSYNASITKQHSVEALHEDIDKLYKKLQRLQPRLYQYTPKEILDFKFDSLKKAIRVPMTSRQFYKQLSEVVKYVRQGHMLVVPPKKRYSRKERKTQRKMKFDINTIGTEYLDDKLFIRQARGKDSALINAEIIAVNGENAMDLFNKYKKRLASDGYNRTFQPRVVGYKFLTFYKFANGRFDSISLTLRHSDSTFIKTYKRVPKNYGQKSIDSLVKDSLNPKEAEQKLTKAEKTLRRLNSKKKRKDRRKRGYDYIKKEYARTLSFIGKDSLVGYLKIKGFKGGKYSKDFYEETFHTLDSLKTETLIIDLRNNFGGRLSEITNLYSYLTDEKFIFINPSEINSRFPLLKAVMNKSSSTFWKIIFTIFSPFIVPYTFLKTKKQDGTLYYKFKASKELEPNPLNFKGKLYVLINGNSFSASSVLSTQLKGKNRATFVGEETGGAYNGTVAGLFKRYELPNTKVKVPIGLMHFDSKFKTTPDGYGIKPDVEIIPTYQDRLKGNDPELEWVIEAVEAIEAQN